MLTFLYNFVLLYLSFQWLNEERLIQRLIDLIHCSQDEDVSRTSNTRVMLSQYLHMHTDSSSIRIVSHKLAHTLVEFFFKELFEEHFVLIF